MKGLFFSLLFISTLSFSGYGQWGTSIDGSFPFMSDTAKKYSIYLPTGYSPTGVLHKTFVCMHPFNTSRWDAQSWRDTLRNFAETNQLILICPDGGTDGNITDAIDTAFTTALIDSAISWYRVRTARIFLMGFSMGGQATYTYGLNNASRFKGLLPVGAVNSYGSEFDAQKTKASLLPIYIIHGSLDAPAVRYFPAIDTLEKYDACVETAYLTGESHTFDFPLRDEYLKDAFVYLDTTSCELDTSSGGTGLFDVSKVKEVNIFPNPVNGLSKISWDVENDFHPNHIKIFALDGRELRSENLYEGMNSYELSGLSQGLYQVVLYSSDGIRRSTLVVTK